MAQVAQGTGIGDIGHGRMGNYFEMGAANNLMSLRAAKRKQGSGAPPHVQDICMLM